MQVALPPDAQQIIDERLRSGKYSSAAEIITAALHALQHDESTGDFAPGEWNHLLVQGEASGKPVDGQMVFDELHRLCGLKK